MKCKKGRPLTQRNRTHESLMPPNTLRYSELRELNLGSIQHGAELGEKKRIIRLFAVLHTEPLSDEGIQCSGFYGRLEGQQSSVRSWLINR